MERIVVYCPKCEDLIEVEYIKGKWYCENCGENLTTQASKEIKKNSRRRR